MHVCPTCAASFEAPGFCTEDGTTLADGSANPFLGRSIGNYRVARLLGQGGMGTVYLGVHPSIGSRVAIKVLSPAASSEPVTVERFFAEARSVNVIRHEGIVNVLDLSVLADGRPYIIMEYLEGAPLSRHFQHTQPFPLDFLARVGIEVSGALGAAHALGITHRDLKPDNIFITSLGRAKVLDFGIAKLRPEHGAQHDGTRTGALLGTPHYMSPEQAEGQPVDPRSDIYSLGVILFEGATGRRPFEAESLFQLLRQHIETPPPPPGSLRPDLPPSFADLITRMLAKDRSRRLQTAAECEQALTVIARELPESQSRTSPPLTRPPATPPPALSAAQVPPTMSATAMTAGAVPEARRPSRTPWLVLGIGLFGFAALVVGGAVLAISGVLVSREAMTQPLPSSGAVATAPTAGATTPSPAGTKSDKHVDPIAKLASATQKAHEVYSDAGLVSLSMTGVDRNGTVDVGAKDKAIAYNFRSPSATGNKCLVNVSISAWGTFTSKAPDSSFDCKQPTTTGPRCKLRDVLSEVPAGRKINSVTYQSSGGLWQWVIMTDPVGTMQIKPDDC